MRPNTPQEQAIEAACANLAEASAGVRRQIAQHLAKVSEDGIGILIREATARGRAATAAGDKTSEILALAASLALVEEGDRRMRALLAAAREERGA